MQYPSPKPFLQAARSHQRDWLKSHLGLDSTHQERVLLPSQAAFAGMNFFDKSVNTTVAKRFPNAFRPNDSGEPRQIIVDALRSEHIPFNLFAPLIPYVPGKELVSFFSSVADIALTHIDNIDFEYADSRAHSALNDNTSFDACVLAHDGNRHVVIGIEVKNTEGPYAWGKTVRRRMADNSDSYVSLTNASPNFLPGSFEKLRNPHLKQIWRNYLLGEQTAKSLPGEFVLLHLFPKGNIYQAAACDDFSKHLTLPGKQVFKPTTYEDFLDQAKALLPSGMANWAQYIRERYVVHEGG